MAEIRLAAAPRTGRGSAATRRLRTAGRIPAIVYGHSVDPISVDVDARELRNALSSEQGANALFDLDIDGNHHLAIARAMQRHPVRHTIGHIDFQVVRRDEVVPADVPIVLIGEATLVHRGGGSVEHLVQAVHVRAKPAEIPVSFEVDISSMEVGHSIRISDLQIPDGVSVEADPETAIVIAHAARAVTEESGEGESGEAGAGDAQSTSSEASAADQ